MLPSPPRFRRFSVLIGLLLLTLGACGVDTEHQYVQSDDGRLSFRLPHEFTDVQAQPTGLEWIAALDADPDPSIGNLSVLTLEHPFVLAQLIDFEPERRDTISLRDLRTFAVPDRRDPLGDHDDLRVLAYEPFVDERGFEGHYMELEVDSDEGTFTEAQLIALDPTRSALHRVRVACSVSCWEGNAELAREILDSVQVRP